MEVDDRRTPDDEVGPQIAAGRDATIHDAGPDRVLRRTGPTRDLLAEAVVMEHVRAAGYPVPVVHRVGPGEQVLERIEGPTMLDDLQDHPWRVDRHARTLAHLHTELHRIAPPEGLRPYELPADHRGADHRPADHQDASSTGPAILHLDLHPGNVILSSDGPVVIDWGNVRGGPAAADVALTWLLMGAFELDLEPLVGPWWKRAYGRAERAATPRIRQRLVGTFLTASGVHDAARAQLPGIAAIRLHDPNVRPGEAVAIRALVEREAPLS